MNKKTATLLRSMCRTNNGIVNKKEVRVIKKWWNKLSAKIKGVERIKMLQKKS